MAKSNVKTETVTDLGTARERRSAAARKAAQTRAVNKLRAAGVPAEIAEGVARNEVARTERIEEVLAEPTEATVTEFRTETVYATEEARIAALEAEGLTTSDAQAVLEAEEILAERSRVTSRRVVQEVQEAEVPAHIMGEVLVTEDDEQAWALVQKALTLQGKEVAFTGKGRLAMKQATKGVYVAGDGTWAMVQRPGSAGAWDVWEISNFDGALDLGHRGAAASYYPALEIIESAIAAR